MLHTFAVYSGAAHESNIHSIFDLKTGDEIKSGVIKLESCEYEMTFSEYEGPLLDSHSMIFIESQRRLIFMGGQLYHDILSYHVDNDKWFMLDAKLVYDHKDEDDDDEDEGDDDGLWEGVHPAIVVTRDEKYAIIIYYGHNVHSYIRFGE